MQKPKKRSLDALFKKAVKSDAHVIILVDENGKVSMDSDIQDLDELSNMLVYIANDLQDRREEFELLMVNQMQETAKAVKDECGNDSVSKETKTGDGDDKELDGSY